MHKEETGDTVDIPIMTVRTLAELDSAKNPNKESLGYDPYNNVPDAESTQ